MSEHYLLAKWLHVAGGAILFGTGIGIAFHLWITVRAGNVVAIAATARATVLADFVFTLPAIVLQPLTGIALASAMGYPLASAWIVASFALYVVAGACWIPVVFIQLRLRALAEKAALDGLPAGEEFHRLARRWFLLGWPAFIAVAAIFWLMIARPA
ncbi:MAG TPA: DUF2269 domain-containing protein [Usitatibacter sp.]